MHPNRVSQEAHVLTKAKDFTGKGTGGKEKQQGKAAQEHCSAVACSLRFYGNGVSFQVVSGQSSSLAHSLTQCPSWWYAYLSARWVPQQRILGG